MQAGGKRLRPVLVLAASELGGRPSRGADPLPAAVAVECIHTYSLIHDDLPCMDNDDLRRGRPTLHKAFDEATALLAGDALLTHAFSLLADRTTPPARPGAALCRELGDAAGASGWSAGRWRTFWRRSRPTATADDLDFIHRNKTAAMIEASLVMGGPVRRCRPAASSKPSARPGHHLGLAFQIVDDILDATADSATLGKTAGKDAKADKTTYVKLHGIEASRRIAAKTHRRGGSRIRRLPGDHFVELALNDGQPGEVSALATVPAKRPSDRVRRDEVPDGAGSAFSRC